MPIALIVLVGVAFVPYLLAAMGGYMKIKQLGYLDNHHPRQQSDELQGAAARTIAAQANAWEALGLYSATIVAVSLAGVPLEALSVPALIFGASRVAHPLLYITNVALLRSIVVVAGVASCFYMVWLAF